MSGPTPAGSGDAGAGPLDFREEVASELRATYRELAGDRERIAGTAGKLVHRGQIAELHRRKATA